MSRKIDEFFSPYPGLELIQNPKVSKRQRKWFESGNIKTPENTDSSSDLDLNDQIKIALTPDVLYKQLLRSHIDKLTFPIKNYQLADPIVGLLESGYHYYINNQLATNPKDNSSKHLSDEESDTDKSLDNLESSDLTNNSSTVDDNTNQSDENSHANTWNQVANRMVDSTEINDVLNNIIDIITDTNTNTDTNI